MDEFSLSESDSSTFGECSSQVMNFECQIEELCDIDLVLFLFPNMLQMMVNVSGRSSTVTTPDIPSDSDNSRSSLFKTPEPPVSFNICVLFVPMLFFPLALTDMLSITFAGVFNCFKCPFCGFN